MVLSLQEAFYNMAEQKRLTSNSLKLRKVRRDILQENIEV